MNLAPKIFHRYMAARFIKPFLFGLGLFAILIFLGDLFDKMPKLARSPASLWVVLQFLWLEVPYWAIRVIPMATLLGTLMAVTGFVASGEWAAVQAAGFETKDFLKPILAMSALVTLVGFGAQEGVLPLCYSRAQRLWRDEIYREWESEKFEDVILVGDAGQFLTARLFLPKEGRLVRPVMDYFVAGALSRELDAENASWDAQAGRWVFRNGVVRSFKRGSSTGERRFETEATDLAVPPLALVPHRQNPDEMTLLETRRYLSQVKRLGASPREAQTAVQAKLAYPFANLIICALGIPIALRLRRANRAVTFSAALGVSFLYLCLLEMGKALGNAGRLPPALAAWSPNLAFGAVAAWLYKNTEI